MKFHIIFFGFIICALMPLNETHLHRLRQDQLGIQPVTKEIKPFTQQYSDALDLFKKNCSNTLLVHQLKEDLHVFLNEAGFILDSNPQQDLLCILKNLNQNLKDKINEQRNSTKEAENQAKEDFQLKFYFKQILEKLQKSDCEKSETFTKFNEVLQQISNSFKKQITLIERENYDQTICCFNLLITKLEE